MMQINHDRRVKIDDQQIDSKYKSLSARARSISRIQISLPL